MEHLVAILVSIACGCVLPIMIIWFEIRRKMNETNQRTQIVLSALEKNPDMDIEELLNKMAPKKKLIKEKLLTKLLWGCITSFIGIGIIGYGWYLSANGLGGSDDPLASISIGLALLGVGVAFLITYFTGKRMLAKEIETEEKKMIEQA